MLKPVKELTDEQMKAIKLPATGPTQIKGVAGSGKSTIALYRGKYLLETHSHLQDLNVIIFTFNRSLASYLRAARGGMKGIDVKDSGGNAKGTISTGQDVTVKNFHKWAYDFLKKRGYWGRWELADSKRFFECIDRAIAHLKRCNYVISNKYSEFYKEEFSFIKGRLFRNRQEYLDTPRTGRGKNNRVTYEEKKILWEAFEVFQEEMIARGLCDFDDYAHFLLEELYAQNCQPQYTHVLVDEAQDLSKAEVLAISKLVKSHTNSISIIADAAQRIYKSGFTWSEVDINVKGGRTKELRSNYRNTVQIANAAQSLLQNEADRTEFTELEASVRNGHRPIIAYCTDIDDQLQYVYDQMRNYDWKANSTVILTRNRKSVLAILKRLDQNGFEAEEIKKDFTDFSAERIRVCTMSSAKGLEFDYVFILDLNDRIIPFPQGSNKRDDAYHISTERRLLYTAMTRASKMLFMVAHGKPTRYLSEINQEYLHLDTTSPQAGRSNSNGELPI